MAIRSYHDLRLLSRTFDVTALCFYRRKPGHEQPDVERSLAVLREICAVDAFPVPQEHSRARLIWDHARSLVRDQVYTRFLFESRPLRRRLEALMAGTSFDLVHLESLSLEGYLSGLRDVPTVCVHHNVESLLLERRGEVQPGSLRARYVRHQARLMEREESLRSERFTLNVAVSDVDMAILRERAPRATFTMIPNGVDTDQFRPEAGREDGIVFVGGNTWAPNLDALQYFGESILPLVRRTDPDVRVRWVGSATERERRDYAARYGIELTGYVTDIRPHVRDAACFVVPLRVGGGTRLKILDAWAMGKALVTTSVGCEGLEAVDGGNALIRDTPESFASAVRDVLHDAALRARLGAAARETVERRYGWDSIGTTLTARYLELLRENRRP